MLNSSYKYPKLQTLARENITKFQLKHAIYSHRAMKDKHYEMGLRRLFHSHGRWSSVSEILLANMSDLFHFIYLFLLLFFSYFLIRANDKPVCIKFQRKSGTIPREKMIVEKISYILHLHDKIKSGRKRLCPTYMMHTTAILVSRSGWRGEKRLYP